MDATKKSEIANMNAMDATKREITMVSTQLREEIKLVREDNKLVREEISSKVELVREDNKLVNAQLVEIKSLIQQLSKSE